MFGISTLNPFGVSMSVIKKLRERIHTPDAKWFHFKATKGDLAPCEATAKPDLSLLIFYKSPREYQRMLAEALQQHQRREVTSTNGAKAIVGDGDFARALVCQQMLSEWKMNMRAAFALELTIDFAGFKGDDEIEYNSETLQVMIDSSNLPGVVHMLVNDHSKWFEFNDEGNEAGVKNFESGPSGSTVGSPVESA